MSVTHPSPGACCARRGTVGSSCSGSFWGWPGPPLGGRGSAASAACSQGHSDKVTAYRRVFQLQVPRPSLGQVQPLRKPPPMQQLLEHPHPQALAVWG